MLTDLADMGLGVLDRLSPHGLLRALKTLPKDTRDPNAYSVIVSELGNGVREIAEAARQLQAAGGFEVVLLEDLVSKLVKETGHRQQCPLPSGPWSRACGDLPRCSIAGNGSCVLMCESIKHGGLLPFPRRASCDLRACHQNLSLSIMTDDDLRVADEAEGRAQAVRVGELRFVCGDGTACPKE